MRSDGAIDRDGAKRCLLSASTIRLRRLRGFPEAVAELAGLPRIASQVALREACVALARVHPRPPGEVRVLAVREGRRTVGHRVADAESVLRIVHGVAEGRTMDASLDGPLVPKVASPAGLRDASPKPWHRDPEVDRRRRDVADRFLAAWTPLVLHGRPGEGWHSALVAPALPGCGIGQSEVVNAIVVLREGAAEVLIVAFGRDRYPLDGTRTEAGVREAIAWALANREEARAGPGRLWQPSSPDHLAEAAMVARIAWSEIEDYNFRKRLEVCWTKVRATALARFRRTLPEEVQRHASLCLKQFSDLRTAAEFLSLRRAWTLQDYDRFNQAIRLVPILRRWVGDARVFLTISLGLPLREAVGAAVMAETGETEVRPPLHAKTVKALRGTWHAVFASGGGPRAPLGRLVAVLESIYRRNPHQRVLGGAELALVARLCELDQVEPDLTADAALAHRDARGRIKPCRDVRDAYVWISRKCEIVIMRPRDLEERDREEAARFAHRIMFPPGRTLAGVEALVAEWHRDQRLLDQAFDRAFDTMLASAFADEGEEVDVDRILYPHFMRDERVVEGVTMRPLVGPEAIRGEGDVMRHCVGTYVGRASGGRSMLVSQISSEGRSTVEVSLDRGEDDEPRFSVVQNRSYENAEPPQVHGTAIWRLLTAVTREDREGLMERIDAASLIANRRAGDAYAALEPEQFGALKEIAHAQLRRFMPRRMRHLGMREWIAHLRRMDPTWAEFERGLAAMREARAAAG